MGKSDGTFETTSMNFDVTD
ncbi:Papilin, partial [Araneus ventricosus]